MGVFHFVAIIEKVFSLERGTRQRASLFSCRQRQNEMHTLKSLMVYKKKTNFMCTPSTE